MSTAKDLMREEAIKNLKLMQESTLENGEMIMTPAEEWAVGVEVFVMGEDGEAMPLPQGEYTLQGGGSIVVENDGVVAAYEPTESVEEEEAEKVEQNNDPAEPKKAEAKEPKSVTETISKELKFEETEVGKQLLKSVATLTEKVNTLTEQFAEQKSASEEKFNNTARFLSDITKEVGDLAAPVEMKKENPEGNKKPSRSKENSKPLNLAAMTVEQRVKAMREKLMNK